MDISLEGWDGSGGFEEEDRKERGVMVMRFGGR